MGLTQRAARIQQQASTQENRKGAQCALELHTLRVKHVIRSIIQDTKIGKMGAQSPKTKRKG